MALANGDVRATGKPSQNRVRLLDFLRGFSVVSMVAYHALYDVVYMFGVDIAWYRGTPGYLWQQSICWTFILVSGAAVHYGRSGWRRGLLVLGCALVLSVVTALAMPGQLIRFGVLHFLGCAMLLAALARPLLQKVPPVVGLLVSAVLFVLLRGLPHRFMGFLDVPVLAAPEALYQFEFLYPLGLPSASFWSSDYFPLLPWLFLFLMGYFGWALYAPRARLAPAGKNPLEWVGRHSLPVYMLHQPVIYGLLWVFARFGVGGLQL